MSPQNMRHAKAIAHVAVTAKPRANKHAEGVATVPARFSYRDRDVALAEQA